MSSTVVERAAARAEATGGLEPRLSAASAHGEARATDVRARQRAFCDEDRFWGTEKEGYMKSAQHGHTADRTGKLPQGLPQKDVENETAPMHSGPGWLVVVKHTTF